MTEVMVRRAEQEAPFGRSEGLVSNPAQGRFRGVGPGSDERFCPPETVVPSEKKRVGAEKEIEVEYGWIGNVADAVIRVHPSTGVRPLFRCLRTRQQCLQRARIVLKEPASDAPQEGVRVHLELMGRGRATARPDAENVFLQESLVHGPSVAFVKSGDDKRQLDIPQATDADFHSVPELVCEEEEGSCVLESLLPEEGKGVLEGGFPPPLLGEVVAEE